MGATVLVKGTTNGSTTDLDGRYSIPNVSPNQVLAVSFIAMAAWALIPDKADDEEQKEPGRYGVFLTTAVAFFLVEMGDKTQIATVALGAKFHSIAWVAAGTTLGMMLANVPAVYLGEAATKIVPLKYVRMGAAAIFLLLGVWQVAELTGLLK